MNRERFLSEADSVGIERDRALSLFERLYAEERATELSRDGTPFGAQTRLSRTVQIFVGLGVLLVIGAHAWWSTRGYEAIGIGIVLALTLIWQVGFLAAAEWARRAGHGLLESGFAAIVAFYTPLTIYSIERLLGARVFMELGSIAAAAALLYRYRRPLLTRPLTLFIGFLLMDATARLAGGGFDDDTTMKRVVLTGGILFGVAGVALDYVAAIDLLVGVWLARVTYLAAGGIIGWIALSMNAHGAVFPFLLMAGGILFIIAGIYLARADSPVRRWLGTRTLPAPQRDLAY